MDVSPKEWGVGLEKEELERERDWLTGEVAGLKAVALSLRTDRDEARAEVERLKRERDEQAARLLGELAAEKVRSAQFSAWWEKSEAEVQEARAKETATVKERDEAKRRADEWEYRAGEWMVRAEDAEAQLAVALERLAKARGSKP